MVAALTEDHKYLTIAVVNGTETAQKLELSVTGVQLAGPSTLWQMTGKQPGCRKPRWSANPSRGKEIAIGDALGSVQVAPISVSIYRFAIAQPVQ